MHSPWSRRQFLKIGGAAAAGLAAGWPWPPRPARAARIGVVVPNRTGRSPVERDATYQIPGEAARRGALLAQEAIRADAADGDLPVEVLMASAPGRKAARRAAARLAALDDVFAIVGGFDRKTGLALGSLAAKQGVLFFNIGAASDALRGRACNRHTFHVQASAAMYLDALADGFTRRGAQRWFFVHANTEDETALYERALTSVKQANPDAVEAGAAVVASNEPVFNNTFKAIRESEPDVVLILLDATDQVNFMSQYEAAGLTVPVTGFADPVTQTRTFYATTQRRAPTVAAPRATLWDATVEADGAQALNARFMERWNQPMEPSAWAAYQSVQMLAQAARSAGSLDPGPLADYLEQDATTFDVAKGAPVSFRTWDHQLRQPLYMVEIDPQADDAMRLAQVMTALPDDPSTDDALDQLGERAQASRCRL